MSNESGTVSIGAAAALFGVPPSTLRWWEEQGVLPAPERVGGHRRYDRRALRRIGLAHLCAVAGAMPLARAATVVSGGADLAGWQAEVDEQVARLGQEIRRLETARDQLRHLLACVDDDPVADCPYLEEALVEHTPRGRVPVPDLLDAAAAATPVTRDEIRSFRHDDRRGRCLHCGAGLPPHGRGRGRPRRYCSAACRQRAHRRRAAAS